MLTLRRATALRCRVAGSLRSGYSTTRWRSSAGVREQQQQQQQHQEGVWVCGAASDGQLGLGPAVLLTASSSALDGEEDEPTGAPVCTPTPLHGFPGDGEQVVLVACGDATTLVAVRPTATGPQSSGAMRVYGWGSTTNRGLPSSQQQRTSRAGSTGSAMPSFFRAKGQGQRDDSIESEPTEFEGLRGLPIKSLSVGRHHTLALVYSFGNGPQLGRRTTQNDPTPQVIGFFEKNRADVVNVSAGWDHSLALSREGELWGWGASIYDQLGFGDCLHVLSPKQITLPSLGKVTHIAAGLTHSIAVVDSREVWGWGDNTRHQLAQLDGAKRQPTPVQLPLPQLDADETVAHLDCGAFHNVIATSKGRIWTWGAGDCGQLGARPSASGVALVTFPDRELSAIDKLVCGAYHSFLLSDGVLYGWGQGTDGQLGNGRRHNEPAPIQVTIGNARVTDVGAGWGHSVFLTATTATTHQQA